MTKKPLEAEDFIESPYFHKKVCLDKDIWAQQIFQEYVIEHWDISTTQLKIFKDVNIKMMDGTSTTQLFNYVFTSVYGIRCFKCKLLDSGKVDDVEDWFYNID